MGYWEQYAKKKELEELERLPSPFVYLLASGVVLLCKGAYRYIKYRKEDKKKIENDDKLHTIDDVLKELHENDINRSNYYKKRRRRKYEHSKTSKRSNEEKYR